MKILAVVLVIVGALLLAYQGITYTRHKTVADIGPLHVESNQKKTVPIPPLVGGVTLAAGVVLLLRDGAR
jgi:hypothetical protein